MSAGNIGRVRNGEVGAKIPRFSIDNMYWSDTHDTKRTQQSKQKLLKFPNKNVKPLKHGELWTRHGFNHKGMTNHGVIW